MASLEYCKLDNKLAVMNRVKYVISMHVSEQRTRAAYRETTYVLKLYNYKDSTFRKLT